MTEVSAVHDANRRQQTLIYACCIHRSWEIKLYPHLGDLYSSTIRNVSPGFPDSNRYLYGVLHGYPTQFPRSSFALPLFRVCFRESFWPFILGIHPAQHNQCSSWLTVKRCESFETRNSELAFDHAEPAMKGRCRECKFTIKRYSPR